MRRKADARSVFVGGCAGDMILRDGKFVIVGPEAPQNDFVRLTSI